MIKFYANSTHFYDKIHVFARVKLGTYLAFPQQIVWTKITQEDEYTAPEPLFKLDHEEAQTLMDALWDCGIRPSEGMGSAGQLAAVQNHLKDMQKIAFAYLDMETRHD